jgi:hypothetical protein
VSPRDVARAYGAGRVALGAGLLAAPRLLGRPWVGSVANGPAGQLPLRALGAREIIIGAIALHTIDHPEVGPRWQRTCAIADAVDALATLAARPALPPLGSALVVAMAAGGAATGLGVARALAGSSGSPGSPGSPGWPGSPASPASPA